MQKVFQKTHCTTADKLMIPKFPIVGSVLSGTHGLVTLFHVQLE